MPKPVTTSRSKLVVNSWILNAVENVAETVAFAQELGIDPQRFLDAIAGGAMDMQYAHLKTTAILSGELEAAFRQDMAAVYYASRPTT